MRTSPRPIHGWTLAALLTALCIAAGCAPSRQEVYRDIALGRLYSFRSWENAEDKSRPYLEGKLSLEEALSLAILHNPTLQQVLQEKERTRGIVIESYSTALPSLTGTANYTRLDQLPALFPGSVNQYSLSLDVVQPLFKVSIPAAIRLARLTRYIADEQINGTVQQVIYNVTRRYWDALLAQKLYETQKAGLESAERQLRDTEAKLEQGLATDYERLRAQVDVSNFRSQAIREHNNIDLSLAGLFREMGVSQRSNVSLSDEMTYRIVEVSFEEAVKAAFENRPDLYNAELVRRAQNEALTVVKSGYWPHAEATFQNRWAKPDPHDQSKDMWGSAWTAGLRVIWPIFDGFRTRGQVIQQEAVIRQSEIALRDTEERALLEVRQALLNLESAKEQVEAQQVNLDRAQKALELVEVGFAEGVNTELEVIDARSALVLAHGIYYQAIYAHMIAKIDLQKATGLIGPRAGQQGVPESVPAPGAPESFRPGAAGTTVRVPPGPENNSGPETGGK